MTQNLYAIARSAISSESLPSQTRREPQRVVKDEVLVAPARDPYSELRVASQRLSEGKSLFAADLATPLRTEK